jgi:tRNA pseudouridine32 synthase/23S rRNA pseudouridine746 synthase
MQEHHIMILHGDDQIVVISKPNNLRSVPGHLNSSSNKKRQRETNLTPQQAWATSIRSISDVVEKDEIDDYISKLQAQADSVPRKFTVFQRYLERNRKRIFDTVVSDTSHVQMYQRIEKMQKGLLKLPEVSRLEDSAVGQLELLGFGNAESGADRSLYVVHRLDCETSGVMVFGRTQEAASFLSKAWRERQQVSKTYVALVHSWPPWQEDNQSTGEINLPLASSDERLKWKVDAKGKPSTTIWSVLSTDETKASPIRLQLTPVTGRTHQLRVHCATIGAGIVGDSLYGSHPVKFDGASKLRLHACRLQFPHPTSKDPLEFMVDPDW